MPKPKRTIIHETQPTNSRRETDTTREFDGTSLRSNTHGRFIHRDYAAHFFRWGFAQRFINNQTTVLDVGCGVECPLARALNFPQKVRPARYVGVDWNPQPKSVPGDRWAEFRWGFDFTRRYAELGKFDLVVTFEVLEHMREADGRKFLAGLRACVTAGGRCLLSTPVFNGKAAANHLHEWTVAALGGAVAEAGFTVEARFGTFASEKDIKTVAPLDVKSVLTKLSAYYPWEVLSCFVAPMFPNQSRNNVWVLNPV